MRSSKLYLSSQLGQSNKQSYRDISSPTSNLFLTKGRTPKANNTFKQSKRINSQQTKTRRNSKSINRSQDKEDHVKSKKKIGNELDQIYKELINLKGEYKSLKQSYNLMIKQKVEHNKKQTKYQEQISQLISQNAQLRKQIERYKSQIDFYGHQLQRIKRESVKLLQIQNFKMQKLEQNLNEKESMIFYLKNRENSDLKDILACSAPITNIMNSTSLFNSKSSIMSPKQTLTFEELHQASNEQNDSKYLNYERRRKDLNVSFTQDQKETKRNDQQGYSDDSEQVELVYKSSQNCNFKKKKELQSMLDCRSPVQKKKRSVTGNKVVTAIKKKDNFKTIRTKKAPNETVR